MHFQYFIYLQLHVPVMFLVILLKALKPFYCIPDNEVPPVKVILLSITIQCQLNDSRITPESVKESICAH